MVDISIEKGINLLGAWIESQGFKGWDPFDALNSPLLKKFTFGNRRVGQFWVQVLKQSPINFRPFLEISKGCNPKAMGLFLGTYTRKYLLERDTINLEQVAYFLDWLRNNISLGYSGSCWGYNFDWPNRGFYAPAGTPTIVNTAFIGLALLDLLDLPSACDAFGSDIQKKALDLAIGACNFISKDLNYNNYKNGELCFSYTPIDNRFVHNANVLGALLLARTWAHIHNEELIHTSLAAIRYTVNHQRPDGSWLYGEGKSDHWIDNFHTGFILIALLGIRSAVNTNEFNNAIDNGYSYWKENFFLSNGAPKYYPDRAYPLDVHSAAQAILTFLAFREIDSNALSMAQRVAKWTISNMQSLDGYFYYQIHRLYTIKIPYMRWGQAWMFRALTELKLARSNADLD